MKLVFLFNIHKTNPRFFNNKKYPKVNELLNVYVVSCRRRRYLKAKKSCLKKMMAWCFNDNGRIGYWVMLVP